MDGLDPFDGDEEAALRYAIALSLQESGVPQSASASEKTTIVLSSDDEEDDLERGPSYPPTPKKTAKGKGSVRTTRVEPLGADPSSSSSSSSSSQPAPTAAAAAASSNSLAALGLDRKKMEEERLARIAKRKAPSSEQESQDRRQRVKLDEGPNAAPAAITKPSRGLPFPKGVVKKTWARGYPRQDDIKIEEVFQKDDLQLAVLSSYQWDEEWMMSKLDIKRTKLVCIAFASSEAQKNEIRANVPKNLIRFCFPPMMPFGTMHSKLQLLKYPNYLRIVVPSGNLVPYDWGETGHMENIVFLIDLPRIEDPTIRSSSNLTEFGEELRYFLKAQGLDESLVNSLANYDFSETSRYRFVHTIGQNHVDEWQRTGYCGLGRAVTSMGLNTSDIEVDFVVSSLGAINMEMISALYNAALGDNGLKEYGKRMVKGGKNKAVADSNSPLKRKFRIYFPSHDTVARSNGGIQGGGTIFAHRKWWNAATFPRELVHDCKSVRKGILMHNKIMFVRHCYPYFRPRFGTNFSLEIRGRLVKDKSTGLPKLNCRNWECGVIIPVPADSTTDKSHHADLTAFQSSVPVPMEFPGEAYGASASKRPWLLVEN
ncbi:phospholipase D/nuclease [Biscogniauxia mediterranea]|nr:phospholipase D/nuclease [Biscogniauxia mediterranea]